MGLEAKRKIKELQDVTLPERQKELLEITGSPLVYDIDWASFADDLEGLEFLDNLSCHRTNMALRAICTDQLARDAIRDGFTTIRLKNVKTKDEMKLAFADRVLEMHLAYALRTDGMYSDNAIREFLLEHL